MIGQRCLLDVRASVGHVDEHSRSAHRCGRATHARHAAKRQASPG
jgi:hypothetical protein